MGSKTHNVVRFYRLLTRHCEAMGHALAFVGALACGSVLSSSLAHAGGFDGDNVGCAFDRPCFYGSHQEGNRVIFNFNHNGGWDLYNVRYAKAGGGENQVENISGSFTFNNVLPNRVYQLSVQGCNKHFLSGSDCSPWAEDAVTTR